jgi:hypothetical protein
VRLRPTQVARLESLEAELRDRLPRLTEELERALADPADADPAVDVLWVAAVAHSFPGE